MGGPFRTRGRMQGLFLVLMVAAVGCSAQSTLIFSCSGDHQLLTTRCEEAVVPGQKALCLPELSNCTAQVQTASDAWSNILSITTTVFNGELLYTMVGGHH